MHLFVVIMQTLPPLTRSAAAHTLINGQHSSHLGYAARLGRPTPVGRLRLKLACGEGLLSSLHGP